MIYLDILRVYACFCVMAVHMAMLFAVDGRIGTIMSNGSNGLGVFYILSGFLVFLSLDNLAKNHGSLKNWYVKRMLRILPLYYFILVVYLIAHEFIYMDASEDPLHIGWPAYFLGLNTVIKPAEIFFWRNLGALASMSVFIWFYILAPLIKKLVCNYRRSIVFFILAYIVMRVLQHTEWLFMFRSYYYFAIGIWIFYAIYEDKKKLTMIVFAIMSVLLIQSEPSGGLLYALCIGMLILLTYDLDIEYGPVRSIIQFLSKRTFAIYIAHTAVIQFRYEYKFERNLYGVVMTAILTIVVTEFLYRVVEQGAVRLYNKACKHS